MSSSSQIHASLPGRQHSSVIEAPPQHNTEDLNETFQDTNLSDLSSHEIDTNFRKMFSQCDADIETVKYEAVTSKYWGTHFPNIKSVPGWQNRFNKITGAIRLGDPYEVTLNDLTYYFSKEHRIYTRGSRTENRGEAYYVAHNQGLDPRTRLRYLSRTATSAFETVHETYALRSEMKSEDYMYFLGVLDNLKGAALTLFNAYIYPERENLIAHAWDPQKLHHRANLFNAAEGLTRMFYQALTGYQFDISMDDLIAYEAAISNAVHELRNDKALMSHISNHDHAKRFKIQEVDHPLIIAANAHANAQRFGKVDCIVGLPFGGLQSSFATRFAMQAVHGSLPSILAVPLSTHSGWMRNKKHISAHSIQDYVRHKLDLPLTQYSNENPHPTMSVLVTDDNSNTGGTFNIMRHALEGAGIKPENIHMSVVEHDPGRIRIKQNSFDSETIRPSEDVATSEDLVELSQSIANPAYFPTAAGKVPIRGVVEDGDKRVRDIQMRRDYVNRLLNQPTTSYRNFTSQAQTEDTRKLRNWLQE